MAKTIKDLDDAARKLVKSDKCQKLMRELWDGNPSEERIKELTKQLAVLLEELKKEVGDVKDIDMDMIDEQHKVSK